MNTIDLLTGASLLVGVVSIVLAIVAISYAKSLEKESRETLTRAQALFAEIDKKAAIFQVVTSETQKQLLETVTSLANPKKLEEQYGQIFMQSMMSDPTNTQKMMEAFRTFVPGIAKATRNGGE
ncbi:MAG TPA: hypothetical protein VFA55_04035 [Candidatus Kapabacteria bacterium]|nr:hypothetical protein [Candidatus Kapabacteria bacterium]